jgi:hypothetical protein
MVSEIISWKLSGFVTGVFGSGERFFELRSAATTLFRIVFPAGFVPPPFYCNFAPDYGADR